MILSLFLALTLTFAGSAGAASISETIPIQGEFECKRDAQYNAYCGPKGTVTIPLDDKACVATMEAAMRAMEPFIERADMYSVPWATEFMKKPFTLDQYSAERNRQEEIHKRVDKQWDAAKACWKEKP